MVDIFLTWVDGTDENWLKEREQYKLETTIQKESNGIERYRSWDNLQYVFRGIENCMPWVNKIFFVTCGQIPPFLNTHHPKLRLVNHKDYIPEKYLPTFNSNTIEMNLFRIEELSENFILFNDDTFPIRYIKEDYYFKNDKVCDEAIERIIGGHTWITLAHSMLNHAWIINRHFDKKKVKKENFWQWYSPRYGVGNIFRNWFMNYFRDFETLKNPHEPFAMKKSIFKKIWDLEPEMLDVGSQNKFRDPTDITQYLARCWQAFEGDFYPRLHQGKAWAVYDNNYQEIASSIREKKYPIMSIDERIGVKLHAFEEAKAEINAAFAEIFPEKSSFEL